MRFSNLHTHTTFSDGVGTVRENIESAIAKNMLSLGFSDHSFTACDTSYCMKLEDYEKYCAEVKTLAAEYKEKLPVFLGIEKDYYSEIEAGMFDYVIASVHYIVKNGVCYPVDHTRAHQEACMNDLFGGNVLDMAKCYYGMVAEHAAVCKPDVIGHFDVLNKFSFMPEKDEKYMYVAEDAFRETFKHCKRFEVNTGGISRGWRKEPYPSFGLLTLLRDLGGEAVINSDSHHPDNLDFYFNESAELLRCAGFETFSVFNGKGFDKIKL
ncbi:MAG: histidinol-phosphatase HisJ family protein [Clostridia bacterium]|nr:histidinol-phosphatase HisJ family protein [Clostridia bacterium]